MGVATWATEKFEQSRPYYGTSRDVFRNNPTMLKLRKGSDRLSEDLNNGVSLQERNRRRNLGYYDGEDVDITDTTRILIIITKK